MDEDPLGDLISDINDEIDSFPVSLPTRTRHTTRPVTTREPSRVGGIASVKDQLTRFRYNAPKPQSFESQELMGRYDNPPRQQTNTTAPSIPPNRMTPQLQGWQDRMKVGSSLEVASSRISLPRQSFRQPAFQEPSYTGIPFTQKEVTPNYMDDDIFEDNIASSPPDLSKFSQKSTPQARTAGAIQLGHAPPTVQGVGLIPVDQLPDRYRSIFPFPVFNAVQSRSFKTAFGSDDNLVLSAPTGSGKTVVMELAMCRLLNTYGEGGYKIIYLAPTKALCAERRRDWEKKMSVLGLTCTELTGDTDQQQLANVRNGDVIVTTPEKWDSMTRRWHDHKKLLEMVRLFLIDEVHFLKDSRGPTLEVIVSRMKSTGINVRIVALSATVPNSEDIANWLGKNTLESDLPAVQERFGEEFRPVKLQKFVYGYPAGPSVNDFQFDKSLEKHLPEIIKKHSPTKPVMIFCMTRPMCVQTAKSLEKAYSSGQKIWNTPRKPFSFADKELNRLAQCGVAFHHAGLSAEDRTLVERLFIERELQIICCTSTLAVGVNLPTHLVILKNTVTWAEGRTKEYADLEVMQMLGRAGRPQFDDTGVAVVMTRKEHKARYEKMTSGQEFLESCLHLNLIEHLNAEISLKMITDTTSAKRWLKSTFFWVRLKKNPSHYKFEGQQLSMNVEQTLDDLCEKDLKQLLGEALITSEEGKFASTAYGTAMAAYYVKFETIKALLQLKEKAKMPDLLAAVSQAKEFSEIRLRNGEKTLYKELNGNTGMRYPLKGDIQATEQKVNILLQCDLGGIEYPPGEPFAKHQSTFKQDLSTLNQHIHRILRCLIDCRVHDKDAVTTKTALELARCVVAHSWENSPTELKQLDGIGPAFVRKLVAANIRSLESLRQTDSFRIESIVSRNPPFGTKILKSLDSIPKFRVFAHLIAKSADKIGPVKVNIRAEVGLLNKETPSRFHGKLIYANFIADTDGAILDFRRIPVYKLEGGKDIKFTGELSHPEQTINCSIFCDEIVGSSATFQLKPDIPASDFPLQLQAKQKQSVSSAPNLFSGDNNGASEDEYEDLEVNAAMEDLDFSHLESFAMNVITETAKNTKLNSKSQARDNIVDSNNAVEATVFEPVRLPNGKWECKHKCTDKTSCKHLCCHEGMDNPPKVIKKKPAGAQGQSKDLKQTEITAQTTGPGKNKLSLLPAPSQRSNLYGPRSAIEAAVKRADSTLIPSDDTNDLDEGPFPQSTKSSLKKLDRLHKKVGNGTVSTLRSIPGAKKEEKPGISAFLGSIIKDSSVNRLKQTVADKQKGTGQGGSRIADNSGSEEDYGLDDMDDDIYELPPPQRMDSPVFESSPQKTVSTQRKAPFMTPAQIAEKRRKRKVEAQGSDLREEEEFFKRNTKRRITFADEDITIPDPPGSSSEDPVGREDRPDEYGPLFFTDSSSSTVEAGNVLELGSSKSDLGRTTQFPSSPDPPSSEVKREMLSSLYAGNEDYHFVETGIQVEDSTCNGNVPFSMGSGLLSEDFETPTRNRVELPQAVVNLVDSSSSAAESTAEEHRHEQPCPESLSKAKTEAAPALKKGNVSYFDATALNEDSSTVADDIPQELMDFLGDCVEFID